MQNCSTETVVRILNAKIHRFIIIIIKTNSNHKSAHMEMEGLGRGLIRLVKNGFRVLSNNF